MPDQNNQNSKNKKQVTQTATAPLFTLLLEPIPADQLHAIQGGSDLVGKWPADL